jgi:hypothetical protein
VQDQLVTLQQILASARITPEHRAGGQLGTSSIVEAHTVNPVLTKLAAGHILLQIEIGLNLVPNS